MTKSKLSISGLLFDQLCSVLNSCGNFIAVFNIQATKDLDEIYKIDVQLIGGREIESASSMDLINARYFKC